MTVALRAFEMQGFASFRNDWRDLHAWQGQLVEVIRPDAGRQSGIALDIDDSGALLIEGPTGVSRVLSGDVSLRPA
jgi:BirA family biotin operon repressor/biotin-[acetyl-CoA-carboxylase] ligase